MLGTSPLPGVGQPAEVELKLASGEVIPLRVETQPDDPLVVAEEERFGQKISTGNLQYADFNPFESSETLGPWDGGYGLARYDDLPSSEREYALTVYKSADGVDASNGHAILAAEVTVLSGFNFDGPVVWFGEFAAAIWAIGGTKVYASNNGDTWSLVTTLPAPARYGAVGVFGRYIIVGMGAAATAKWIDVGLVTGNVQDSVPANIYVWAFTADRDAAYVAGGSATSNYNQVMSSTTGISYTVSSAFTCGGSESEITALAPGGGLGVVFVGKTRELGLIHGVASGSTVTNIYQVLVPFDGWWSSNCYGLRWYIARSGDEQRGPLALVFTRDRSLWMYLPNSATAGEAVNISPWADSRYRPPITGLPTGFTGNARWLFYLVHATDGTWLFKRDNRTGVHHPQFRVHTGAVTGYALGLSTTVKPITVYFARSSTELGYIRLPLDGENALDAPVPSRAQGTLSFPEITLGFPNEPKVGFGVDVSALDLLDQSRFIRVFYGLDGAARTTQLGTAYQSPVTQIDFDAPEPSFRSLGIDLQLNSTTSTDSPELVAVTVRMSLNPKPYRVWEFTAVLGAPSKLPGDALQNAKRVIDNLRAVREAGVPVEFRDIWNDRYRVRLLDLKEYYVYQDRNRTPEARLRLKLLEKSGTTPVLVTTTYALSACGASPVADTPPDNLCNGVISATFTVDVTGSETIYPVWGLRGAFYHARLLNNNTAEELYLTSDVGHGNTVTLNCAPSKRTVVDSNGVDRFGELRAGSRFWGFVPGTTSVTILLGGGSVMSTPSAVLLSRRPNSG